MNNKGVSIGQTELEKILPSSWVIILKQEKAFKVF